MARHSAHVLASVGGLVPKLDLVRRPVEMTVTDYEVDGREAHVFGVGGGHALTAELYEGYFALAWTCSLPAAEAVARISQMAPAPDGAALLYTARSPGHRRLALAEAIEEILRDRGELQFYRLEWIDRTFTWEGQEEASDPAARGPAAGRLGLLAGQWDPAYLRRVLSSTGTTEIREAAEQLVDKAGFVAAGVSSGVLDPGHPSD